jgi:hypothetical protein
VMGDCDSGDSDDPIRGHRRLVPATPIFEHGRAQTERVAGPSQAMTNPDKIERA